MQTFVLLSTIFALLAAYFEYRPQPHPVAAPQTVASVIRDREVYATPPIPEAPVVKISRTPASSATATATASNSRSPLNLQLPTLQHAPFSHPTNKHNMSGLFDNQGREKISYDAELVFDSKTGEDITGGKVNVRIPLT